MKCSEIVILMVSLSAVPQMKAQVNSPERRTESMSHRDRDGVRGPVRSCTEESTYPGVADSEGRVQQVRTKSVTEYDTEGRVTARRYINPDGSEWTTHDTYDASGRLLKSASGMEGQEVSETVYSYDAQGKLQSIRTGARSESPTTFSYDAHGRKTKVEISRAADYRPNFSTGGSPFEALDTAPNLPGGGSATTIYDEHDRAIRVEVRDAEGTIVNRAERTYDSQGRILEEKQILDHPEAMIPPEKRAKIVEQSGLSYDQLREELRTKFTELMAGHSGTYTVSFSYDDKGRPAVMRRRIFDREEEIETTYNDHGDVSSEITRSKTRAEEGGSSPLAGMPPYSEVRYSYKYDDRENWIEKTISYRSSPDGTFQASSTVERTLTYY
jgi:YD repeat-containing protein